MFSFFVNELDSSVSKNFLNSLQSVGHNASARFVFGNSVFVYRRPLFEIPQRPVQRCSSHPDVNGPHQVLDPKFPS